MPNADRGRGVADPASTSPPTPLEGPDAVLAALDPEQREVVLAVKGPVCVLAGAGTGKTRAVAHRIAYAAAIGVVRPDRVLAVTFTAKAAGELRARLRYLGSATVPGAGLGLVQARTFHAAALRQLTHFWGRTVGGQAPVVLDSKVGLLAEAARRLRLRVEPAELRDVAAEVEWAKVCQVRPDDYPVAAEKADRAGPLTPDRVAALYARYEELRRERNLVDFESVLELTAAILIEHPAVAAAVRDRYRYFVVDEYQDVNPLQKLLLDQWAGDRDDVCVVGDPRQTIYSFTGASPGYLTGFARQYQGAVVIRLVRNYRSTPQVVALANRIAGERGSPTASAGSAASAGVSLVSGARAGGARVGGAGMSGAGMSGTAALVAQRAAGPAPRLTEYPDEQAEAADVARVVAELIRAGTSAREIAILVRTNAMTAGHEEALDAVGVPFQLRGAERFFERAEVKQAIGLLRVAARSAAPDEDPASAVRPVLTGLGLAKDPPRGRGQARERWESLAALEQLAADFFARTPGASVADLAAELELRSSIGHAPDPGGVTLASLHAAKGLEWDAVFLPGLTDGIVPIVYAQTAEAIEEERRLLYVGVTRARQRLYLSWALARSPGGRRSKKPSRFLDSLRAPDPTPGLRGSPSRASKAGAEQARADRIGRLDAAGQELFARLRDWRLAAAREQSVPAYVVFSDATLEVIAARRPRTPAELAVVPGVGAVKLDRYGAAVLALCADDAQ